MSVLQRSDWPRLLELLDVALDIPAGEVSSWLAGVDLSPAVRKTLEEMLDKRRDVETGDFLSVLPILGHDAAVREGDVVGGWRLVRRIGDGGMSTVWLGARADDQVKREVAIKLPHTGPGQESLVRRLLRERNILAGLEHANIARLYEVGLTETGTPYLVMEFVSGTTVLAHADAHRLSLAQRVDLFQQILAAVQYAHGKLVLHRDLKPLNVLVTDGGEVKLLDFGIAKVLAETESSFDATELTHSGGRPLTPAYASPEQLRGLPLSTASDVYSLGVILCELLCGERAHVLSGPSAARHEEAVLTQDPRPPSRRHPTPNVLQARGATARNLRKSLSGDLDAIVLKALERLPEHRYASASALSADLAQWRGGRPVAARVPSLWYYGRKFVVRHKLAVSSATVAIGAVFAAGGVAILQSIEARHAAAAAVAARQFMEQLFESTDPDLFGGHQPSATELLAQGRAKLLAAGSRDAALPVNELLSSVARAQFQLGDSPAADVTIGLLLQRLASPQDAQLRIKAWLQRTNLALSLTRIAEAKDALAHARSEADVHGSDPAMRLTLAAYTGAVALHDGRLDDARHAYENYFTLASGDANVPASEMLSVRLGFASVESRSGNRAAAYDLLRDAEALTMAHPELAGVRFRQIANFRSSIDIDSGRYAELGAWLPSTIEECIRALGPRSIACRVLDARQVRVLLKQGRGAAAASFADALRYQLDQDPSAGRRIEAAVLISRAAAAAGHREDQEAMRVRLEKMDLPDQSTGLDPEYRLLVKNTLAELALSAGDTKGALAWTTRARQIIANAGLSTSNEARRTALFEGIALAAEGKDAMALAVWGSQCEEVALAESPLQVRDRLFSLNCARSLAVTGRGDDSINLVRKALPILREGLGADAPVIARAETLLDELTRAQLPADAARRGRPPNYFS
jgi:hypothetical protein